MELKCEFEDVVLACWDGGGGCMKEIQTIN